MLKPHLNREAQALVDAAREGLRPPTGARERLEALLDARIASGAEAPSAGTVEPLRARPWHLAGPIAVGVALVGAAAFFGLRADETHPLPPSATAAQVLAPVPAAALPSSPASDLSIAPSAQPAPVSAASASKAPVEASAAPSRTRDHLAEEVALLSRATSALRAGQPSIALKALDEHQRQFPKGILEVERRGARAQALCSLKHVPDGRAELARLPPQAPAAVRAKQVCDAASPVTEAP